MVTYWHARSESRETDTTCTTPDRLIAYTKGSVCRSSERWSNGCHLCDKPPYRNSCLHWARCRLDTMVQYRIQSNTSVRGQRERSGVCSCVATCGICNNLCIHSINLCWRVVYRFAAFFSSGERKFANKNFLAGKKPIQSFFLSLCNFARNERRGQVKTKKKKLYIIDPLERNIQGTNVWNIFLLNAFESRGRVFLSPIIREILRGENWCRRLRNWI